jgi:hypothetical protein
MLYLVPLFPVTGGHLSDALLAIYKLPFEIGVPRQFVQVIGKDLDKLPDGVKPLSRNFFGLWEMHMKGNLWENAYKQWDFALPALDRVDKFHQYIVNPKKQMRPTQPAGQDDNYRYKTTSAQSMVTLAKIWKAVGKERDPDQQTVMNHVSATEASVFLTLQMSLQTPAGFISLGFIYSISPQAGDPQFFEDFPDYYSAAQKYGAEVNYTYSSLYLDLIICCNHAVAPPRSLLLRWTQ